MRRCLAALALASLLSVAPARAQDITGGFDLASLELPPGLLELKDLVLFNGSGGGVAATATTSVMGTEASVFLSVSRGGGTQRAFTLGMKPKDWSLTKAFPQLDNPLLQNITFERLALVVSNVEIERSSAELTDEEWLFYREVYGQDEFSFRIMPGISLIAAIPVERLEPGHPLLLVMDALGIEKGVVLVQGTLGKSLTMLGRPGAGGRDIVRDLYLRAELPPMRPPGSPSWFRHGQLALEITGDPSLRLVGEVGVTMQGEDLLFFLATTLARTGVSLSGGLVADEDGWQRPFGIEWLTLYKVVLKIGVTPTGSVALGFGASMVIGEKDMDVAVAVAISPAGVPTNFIFAGQSEDGFGMSDLLAVQQQMAAARAAAQEASGRTGPLANVRIPLDALPPIELKQVALKFAPKPEPDLGIDRGIAIKGRLWLPLGPGGELKDFAGVDVNVGEDGFWIRGDLSAFQAGPLVWHDALLDLTATPEQQHLIIKGEVELFASRRMVDLEVSRTGLRFVSERDLFGVFRTRLDVSAAFNLQQPAFRVHGVVESDVAEVVGPVVRQGALNFAGAGRDVLDAAERALGGVRTALGNAELNAAQLRERIAAQRAAMADDLASVEALAAQAYRSAVAARNARDRAYDLWRDTPLRQAALRAQRRAAHLAWVARYTAAAADYAARAAGAEARRRILAALPPVDQSILVLAADAAVVVLRQSLTTAEQRLTALQAGYDEFLRALEQAGPLLDIDRAEVFADLEALMARQGVRWSLTGSFLGRPFALDRTINFADLTQGAGELLAALVHR